MGSLVKRHFARTLGAEPQEVYHVTVMPCYDKKLEASRKDFYDEITRAKDVDTVLTSTEVGHARGHAAVRPLLTLPPTPARCWTC